MSISRGGIRSTADHFLETRAPSIRENNAARPLALRATASARIQETMKVNATYAAAAMRSTFG